MSQSEKLADVLTDASVADRRVGLSMAIDHVEIDSERGVAHAFAKRPPVCPKLPSATRDHG